MTNLTNTFFIIPKILKEKAIAYLTYGIYFIFRKFLSFLVFYLDWCHVHDVYFMIFPISTLYERSCFLNNIVFIAGKCSYFLLHSIFILVSKVNFTFNSILHFKKMTLIFILR